MNLDIIYFIISYLAVLIIGYILMNFLSNGFFGIFIKVKMSRGSLIMVEVKGLTETYYKAGKISGEWFTFKDALKEQRRIKFSKSAVERVMGITRISMMDVTNQTITYQNNLNDGFDSVKYDNLMQRCLMKPQIKSTKDIMQQLLILLIIGGILLYLTYQIFTLKDIVMGIKLTVDTINKVGIV